MKSNGEQRTGVIHIVFKLVGAASAINIVSTALVEFCAEEVSENLVDNCLIFNTAVRRIGKGLPRERQRTLWASPWKFRGTVYQFIFDSL